MNIFTGGRGHPKKVNMPHSSEDEPNDDNAPSECWGSEQLTNG
jgi:hypothetical protein